MSLNSERRWRDGHLYPPRGVRRFGLPKAALVRLLSPNLRAMCPSRTFTLQGAKRGRSSSSWSIWTGHCSGSSTRTTVCETSRPSHGVALLSGWAMSLPVSQRILPPSCYATSELVDRILREDRIRNPERPAIQQRLQPRTTTTEVRAPPLPPLPTHLTRPRSRLCAPLTGC